MFKPTFLILTVVVLLTACNVSRTYQSPEVNTTGLFRGTDTSDTLTTGALLWNEMFTDTALQRLIAEGIQNNLQVQVAYTRVQQAQAFYLQSGAAFFPTLSANTGVTESKFSAGQGFGARPPITQFQLGLSSSWEADIWGRLRASRRANLANLLQSQVGVQAVETGLVGSIANLYYTLLALDQQLIITQQTVRNWDTTVSTMRALKEAARVTEAAVVQSQSQLYAAEVTIPDLRQRIRETEHAMSTLLGRVPDSIRRGSLIEQQPSNMLHAGVPTQLLANRPDVQAAELAFRNAFELTNVARAAFYPSLSITASAGLFSLALPTFFDIGSLAASIGVGLTQPIFNRRLNRTNLLVAEAEQQAALLNFKNALLTAGQEVSDAISLHETALQKMDVRGKQLDALQKSVLYSQELLRNGFANYTEVINARQFLLQAELGRVNDRLQQLQARVNLYRALGGGWR